MLKSSHSKSILYFGNLVHRQIYNILQDSKRLRTWQVPQQKQIHPIPKQIFENATLITLIRLQTAFSKLKQQQIKDPQTQIKKIEMTGINKLEIQSGQGFFIFEGKHQLSTLFYNSPFNGPFKYYYDLDTQKWLSNKDKHILQQNLAREVHGKFYAFLDL